MVRAYKSRYSTFKSIEKIHKGKPVKDLVNSKRWRKFISEDLENIRYKVAVISPEMEFRPDLISFAAYGTVKLWWVICTANGITDPNVELSSGKQIKIPIL